MVLGKNITRFSLLLQGRVTCQIFSRAIYEVIDYIVFKENPAGAGAGCFTQSGSPYSATHRGRLVSFGTDVIKRFVRPDSFHDIPDDYLQGEFSGANLLRIWKKVNGLIKELLNR